MSDEIQDIGAKALILRANSFPSTIKALKAIMTVAHHVNWLLFDIIQNSERLGAGLAQDARFIDLKSLYIKLFRICSNVI